MRIIADALFYLNEDIKHWFVPQFEIETSFDVLVHGTVCRNFNVPSSSLGHLDMIPTFFDEWTHPKPLPKPIAANLLNELSFKVLQRIEKVSACI